MKKAAASDNGCGGILRYAVMRKLVARVMGARQDDHGPNPKQHAVGLWGSRLLNRGKRSEAP